MNNTVRPTKKQRELLDYIEQFIGEHGYSPSYREIMNGLGYTSVATVSLHVTSLIRRGHLRKRDRSARSLEVVRDVGASETSPVSNANVARTSTSAGGVAWLISETELRVAVLEASDEPAEPQLGQAAALVQALYILGQTEAAEAFTVRLARLDVAAVRSDAATKNGSHGKASQPAP
jgi:SOS-response transcriptional repressor LexA